MFVGEFKSILSDRLLLLADFNADKEVYPPPHRRKESLDRERGAP
jgi:hypothetical protein